MISFIAILATLTLALIGGRILLKEIVFIIEAWTTLREKLPHKTPKIEGSYSEKLQSLTKSLTTASQEMDVLLNELTEVSNDRQIAIEKVEADLAKLQVREAELQERIEHLQKVPLPVAEYFARLTVPSEKRNAKRDYFLFGAGVIVSTLIAILLKLVGIG